MREAFVVGVQEGARAGILLLLVILSLWRLWQSLAMGKDFREWARFARESGKRNEPPAAPVPEPATDSWPNLEEEPKPKLRDWLLFGAGIEGAVTFPGDLEPEQMEWMAIGRPSTYESGTHDPVMVEGEGNMCLLCGNPWPCDDSEEGKALRSDSIRQRVTDVRLRQRLRSLAGQPGQEGQYYFDYEKESRPEVVCLCGSTRFSEAFREANLAFTLADKIILTIGCDTKSDDGLKLTQEDKTRLDALHMQKVKMADTVLILNVDGYIGKSTGNELRYACKMDKRILFLEGAKVKLCRMCKGHGRRGLKLGQDYPCTNCIGYGYHVTEDAASGEVTQDFNAMMEKHRSDRMREYHAD